MPAPRLMPPDTPDSSPDMGYDRTKKTRHPPTLDVAGADQAPPPIETPHGG